MKRAVTVAPFKDKNEFNALGAVLGAAGLYTRLDRARERSGKEKKDFTIIVKPDSIFKGWFWPLGKKV